MATPTRFVVGLLALLAVPAAVIVLPSANVADAFSHFPGNYLFMAWPNLAVALLAVWPRFRCRGLLYSIATLNAVLIGFALWVRLAVPARESGLAWVIYFPVAGIALLLLAVTALVLHQWRSHRKVGA